MAEKVVGHMTIIYVMEMLVEDDAIAECFWAQKKGYETLKCSFVHAIFLTSYRLYTMYLSARSSRCS